jgi:hypothetical protein
MVLDFFETGSGIIHQIVLKTMLFRWDDDWLIHIRLMQEIRDVAIGVVELILLM